jgi:hypothetical protein
LVVRPWHWLRLSVGGMTNSVSAGGRAGVLLAPLHRVLTPTLSAEVGRFLDGDANQTAAWVLKNPAFHSDLLTHVGYTFFDTMLGFEVGAPDRWVISLRAGISDVIASPGFSASMTQWAQQLSQSTGGILSVNTPRNLWLPAGQLGVTVFVI